MAKTDAEPSATTEVSKDLPKPDPKDQPVATDLSAIEKVQTECESFIQDKLNDPSVTQGDLWRVLRLVQSLAKSVRAA